MSNPQLSRKSFGRKAAPERILHIGLGNFTRAHQAWYTEHASDANNWGIAAFTGRSARMANLLNPQDGLYTLITKGNTENSSEIISSISSVHPAADFATLIKYFISPELAIVTSTVTEAGYYRAADGSLDRDNPQIAADLKAAKTLFAAGAPSIEEISALEISSAPVRVMLGLAARSISGSGKLTILPCDNIPDNGASFCRVVSDAAQAISPELMAWIEENISWATCMVDRITPATTETEKSEIASNCGYIDAAPVPTEPFNEWVIAGEFPAGRPDWESAGAQIVDDVEPYEQRKLRMLNGSHSLMAYVGPILGKETVEDAIKDPQIRSWVEAYWQEAGPELSIPWEDYAAKLVERFENPNIRHLLAQIAHDGSQKIPVRIVPTLHAFRNRGEMPAGCIIAVAAWIQHLRGYGAPLVDAAGENITSLVGNTLKDDVQNVLNYLHPDFTADAQLCTEIETAAQNLIKE